MASSHLPRLSFSTKGNGLDYIMKFTNQHSDGTKIEIEIAEHASMDAVLKEFQNFLRACGYVIEYNQCLVLENME